MPRSPVFRPYSARSGARRAGRRLTPCGAGPGSGAVSLSRCRPGRGACPAVTSALTVRVPAILMAVVTAMRVLALPPSRLHPGRSRSGREGVARAQRRGGEPALVGQDRPAVAGELGVAFLQRLPPLRGPPQLAE